MPSKLIINVDTPSSYHPVVERLTPPPSPPSSPTRRGSRQRRNRRRRRRRHTSSASSSTPATTPASASLPLSPQALARRRLSSCSTTSSSGSSEGTAVTSDTLAGGGGDIDELTCACCYSLLREPTTLTCGHTFCRSCIATWYLQSKQTSCPECRQKFYGVPQINIMIRNILEKQYPERLTVALVPEQQDSDRRKLSVIREFEDTLKRSSDFNNRESKIKFEVGIAFCKGVIVTLALLLITWMVSYVLSPSLGSSQRPLYKWTVDDTHRWLADLGPWVDFSLVPYFQTNKIDGKLLMAMNDTDFERILEDTPPLQRRAFNMSLSSVRDFGVKLPTNIWEFKSIYFGKSILLCYYLQYKPRLAILALYLFEYSELFLPFVHLSLPKTNVSDINMFTTEFPEPSLSHLAEFSLTLLCLPYLLIGQLLFGHCGRLTATSWSAVTNCAAVRMQLVNCFVLSVEDMNALRILYKRSRNNRMSLFLVLRHEITDLFLKIVLNSLMLWLWWVLPSLVWNAAFYACLFAFPFVNAVSLAKNLQY